MDYGTSECIYTSDKDEFTCALEVTQVSQKGKGQYECVVNTAYRIREISQTVIQFEYEMWIVEIGKLMLRLMISVMVSYMLSLMLGSWMESWMKTCMETSMISSIRMGTLIGTLVGTMTGILAETLTGTLIGTLWGTLMGILIVPLVGTLKAWGKQCKGHYQYKTPMSKETT